ncbi:MAG: hypothetical protein ACK5NA_09015 [Enterococcus sp.]
MTSILRPDSGNCEVLGISPTKNRLSYVKRIGAVFGNRSNLLWDLPLQDSIELMQRMYKIPTGVFERNRTELIEMMAITDLLKTPVRQLSLGLDARSKLSIYNQ